MSPRAWSRAGFGSAVLLIGYLLLWPIPAEPEAWSAPDAPEDVGPLAPNDALAGLKRTQLEDGHGPEDIEVDAQGRVYGGVDDGRILRWTGDRVQTFADTGGRPLGLHWDAAGNLLVADAFKGLLSIDSGGNIRTLATAVDGQKLVFTDDLDVSAEGIVYFTDASTKFDQKHWKWDLIESQPNGRLLSYDLATGKSQELRDGLYFANGVALDPAGQFVLFCETTRYRIQKLWLAGPKQGQMEVVIDNLPGFPDGISTGSDGIYWIAIASPRNPLLDRTSGAPWLRKVILRLPKFLQPAPVRSARTIGIDAEGRIVHHLYDPEGTRLTTVTSVQERGGTLYLGSLTDTAWGKLPVPHR